MHERPAAVPPWKLAPNQHLIRDYVFAPILVPADDPLYAQAAALAADLPLRIVVRDNWLALAVYAAPGATRHCLLLNDEYGWSAGGGGASSGGPELPLRAGVGGSWTTPISTKSFAAVTIKGTAAADITRIHIEFDDGHVEESATSHGAFAWFYARRPAPPRPPEGDAFAREVLGAEPLRVIGRTADGREVARQEMRLSAN
jgi:hypothetical protein